MLFTVVDDVRNLKDKMMEEGATYAQTGHFYVQNKPQSVSQGNELSVKIFSLGNLHVVTK